MRVIQIGYGYWGANIARKLVESPIFELAAVCELKPELRDKARRELPESVAIEDDYTRYLATDNIDAFVIATQTEYSFAYAMAAMDAGKHVFIEKPIATTVERTIRLKEKAEEKGVILHCDHIMLYNPYYRYIKGLIDAGELGDLMYYETDKLNLGPIRRDVNALMDLAVHDIALLDWYTGGKMPEKVLAMGCTPFGQQETMTYLTLQYGKMMAGLRSSWISPVKVRRTVIAGTKKMVVFDDMLPTGKVKLYDAHIDVQPGDTPDGNVYTVCQGDVQEIEIAFEDSIRNSLEAFADCAQRGVQSPSGPEQSLCVMRILEAAQQQLGKDAGGTK